MLASGEDWRDDEDEDEIEAKNEDKVEDEDTEIEADDLNTISIVPTRGYQVFIQRSQLYPEFKIPL